MSKKRWLLGFLGLVTALMGALPWLQPKFSALDFLPSSGDAYSGIFFVLGAIIFLVVLFMEDR